MRKGVKKEVEVTSMGEELKVFYEMQRGIAINKVILLIALTLALFVLCGINGAVIFSFLLLIATEIFCNLSNICSHHSPSLLRPQNDRKCPQNTAHHLLLHLLQSFEVGCGNYSSVNRLDVYRTSDCLNFRPYCSDLLPSLPAAFFKQGH